MDKFEREIQDALGLLHWWDIYTQYAGDTFYTIYVVKAPTKGEALARGYEIIFKQSRTIIRNRDGTYRIFAVGPDPAKKVAHAQHATRPYETHN